MSKTAGADQTALGQHIELSNVDITKMQEVPLSGKVGSGRIINQVEVPGRMTSYHQGVVINPPKNPTEKVLVTHKSSSVYEKSFHPKVDIYVTKDDWINAIK